MPYLYTNKLKQQAMKTTVKRNDSGKVREVNVYVPSKEDDQVEWYVNKFFQKMMWEGCEINTAKDWVDGIGDMLSSDGRKRVWNEIRRNTTLIKKGKWSILYTKSVF